MKTQAGPGALIVHNPLGDYIAVPRQGASFAHAFKGFLTGEGIRFSTGRVLGTVSHEPTIDKVPIGKGAVLKLESSVVASKSSESWACVEVTPNADGSTDEKTLVEMVHRSSPFSDTPKIGRQPICLILWQGPTPIRLIQIVMFNLRYMRTSPTAGKGIPKHFFA